MVLPELCVLSLISFSSQSSGINFENNGRRDEEYDEPSFRVWSSPKRSCPFLILLVKCRVA
jgi:hypothetical protein